MQAGRPDYLAFDPAKRRVKLDPREDRFVQNPYAAYAFLHESAPVFFWQEYGFWCLAGHDAVNRVFRDRRFGRERPGGYLAHVAGEGKRDHLADFDRVEAASMLEIEPPVHTRLRRLVNRAFVSRQVERLRPAVEQLAHDLIDRIEGNGRADLIRAFATPVPIAVIADMMGVPRDKGAQLVAWSNDMVRMYMHAPSRAVAERANASAAAFAAFIRAQADKRRADPGDDLLSVLVSAHESGERLTEDELVSSAILLLNAGHEATVHQIGNAVRAILSSGRDPAELFASDRAAAETVEECLRFDAPLHMFTRFAYEQAEIADGITVRRGDQVGLLLGAANSDPAIHAEPRRFAPSRAGQKHVSFGAGIHFCIGAPLARLEMQVALRVLFERLPGLRMTEEPRYRDIYHFHGLERLVCEWR